MTTADFVYEDFFADDFLTQAPSSCDFVEGDFVLGDFQICVTPVETSSGTGIGGFSPRRYVVGYRGSTEPPFEIKYQKKPEPKHIIIEVEPEKITDTLGKRIEELVITKPEPIPINIDFIPVRKTINNVRLVEEPKEEKTKIDFARIKAHEKERKRKDALKKKLDQLRLLLDLTFIEHYV